MKKIIAIYPSTGLDKAGGSVALPLSLLHAFSEVVKEGHKVEIIDQRVDKEWRENLINELKKDEILYVAISSMTGAQINGMLAAAKLVKEISPRTLIVLGGIHASLLPIQTLKSKYVDIVVMGEGELTALELTKTLLKEGDLEEVAGIGFKTKDNKIKINKPRELPPIDQTVDIPYELVDINDYFINLYGSKNSLSLQAGRGCPHRCTYCYNSIFNKMKWRGISAENIVKKIKTLKGFGASSVDLVDDNFFTSTVRAKEFVELLEKEKLDMKLLTNIRADYLARMDVDFLKRLKKIGFNEMFVGIESGSDRVLKLIKKDVDVKRIIESNNRLRESGIKAIYSFMAGFPGETTRDINKTIDLMVKLKKDNPNCALTSLKIFTPFPGTELYNTCIEKGFKPPQTLKGWSKFNYNYSGYKLRTKKISKLLEKLSYMTYFLDKKTMIKHVGGNAPLNMLIKIYASIIGLRCKIHFYHFTPEISILKFLQNKLFGKGASC